MDDTLNDQTISTEDSMPPEIAAMGVDAQALFEKVSRRLGLRDSFVQIDRYQLRARIGEGGMGVVYLAWDPQLGREVAIKVVGGRPLLGTTKLRARLLREAKLLAKLQHRNVVTVHDAGEHAGEVFVAMEYVRGQSLREWQEQARRPLAEILRVYIEAGRGLAAAHAQGIIHRDFKPENVFIDAEGHAVVGDFGLANTVAAAAPEDNLNLPGTEDALARVTQAGELLGTVAYMAPEQLRGDPTDARSDQYSYCVALWEAATGQRPFVGPTREALATAMRGGPPGGGEKLPKWLRRTLETGLAPDPEHRHRDMDALVTKLERGLGRGKRWFTGVSLALAGAFGLAGAGVLWTSYAPQECSLADRITELRAVVSTPPDIATENRGRLDTDLRRLEHAATRACEASDLPATQYIERWVATIESVLTASVSPGEADLKRLARWLEHARYDRPPHEPISTEVFEALVRAESAEYVGQLAVATAASDEALSASRSDVDLAEAHLQRGRARLLAGDYSGALVDCDAAHLAALRCGFVDAQLRARILAVKTHLMRLEQLGPSRAHLEEARAHLIFLAEPLLSPRRVDIVELAAALDKHQGFVEEAARRQFLAVGLRWLAGHDAEELASALNNLGTIEQWYRDDMQRAELAYRLALVVCPGFPHALLNFSHLLNELPRELTDDEIEFIGDALLRLVDADGHDLHVQVHTELLKLALRVNDTRAALASEQALEQALQADHGRTPTNVANAWRWLVLARARRGEFGDSYRRANQAWLDVETDASELERLEWELTAVELAAENHALVARTQLERVSAEILALPESTRQQELLQHSRTLGASIRAPH